jgi:radical SAM protein with 4Fe4S-binding SPASM domain
MDWELYKKIIDELLAIKTVEAIGFNFGGESLLHKRFPEMVQYAAKANHFALGFNTNGLLLSESISRVLVESGVRSVTISLDGLKEWHERIRHGSNYDLVEKNVKTLKTVRGQQAHPNIVVNLTESAQSRGDVKAFVRHWLGIADRVEIYPRLSEELKLDLGDRCFKHAVVRHKRCSWPSNYMAILWNGDVTTCCHDINGVNFMGNVAKSGVAAVWQGQAYRSLRYQAYTNSFEKDTLCSRCTAWKISLAKAERKQGNIRVHLEGLCRTYKTQPGGDPRQRRPAS